MSALTEKVAREHMAWRVSTDYVLCACDEEFGHLRYHAEHIAEVTEAATRAAVAADIRAMYPEMSHHVLITERRQALYDGMREAARIAEGKQP